MRVHANDRMSEALPLKSKYIKIGRGRGFQDFLTQPPVVIVCHVVESFDGYQFTALRL